MARAPRPEPDKLDALFADIRAQLADYHHSHPAEFDAKDVARVANDDYFLEAYARCASYNAHDTLERVKASLAFRRRFNMCNMVATDFPAELFQLAIVFTYEPDRHGNRTIYFRACKNYPLPDIRRLQRYFCFYQIEKVWRETTPSTESMITFVADCSELCWSNVDMTQFVYFVNHFYKYAPDLLGTIIIYNLPYLFHFFVKLLLSMAPGWFAGELLVLRDAELFDYIDRANVPPYLGGTCTTNNHYAVPEGCRSGREAHFPQYYSDEMVDLFYNKYQPYLQESADEARKYFNYPRDVVD